MKKIIAKSILFLLILFLILLILSRIFIPKNNTLEAGIFSRKFRQAGILAEPKNTIDVIITGDSESYTSYVPLEAWKEHGYTSYVCGASGQKLPEIMSFMQQALEKQQPKIILLETNTIHRKASLKTPVAEIAKRILPIIEYHDRWKSLNANDYFGKIEYTSLHEFKGFYYKTKIKSAKNKEYMKETNSIKEVNDLNKLYIKTMKEYCDSRGIKLILYSCPSSFNWNMKKHNGIEKLAQELDLEYIDLNLKQDEIKIDWTKDTRDKGDHLNYTGALKVTKYLGKYLSEKNLPDHREDESYKSWDEAYNNYIEKVKK